MKVHTDEELAKLRRQALREGYERALWETGPRARTNAQREQFAEHYRQRALLQYPEPK